MALDDKAMLVDLKLRHLAVQRDRDTWLRGLAELCAQAVEAERSTIWIVDATRNELWARVATRTTLDLRLPIGSGLAGYAAKFGETINVPNAYADPRFDRGADLRSGFRTMNVLVVPVQSAKGRVTGVIQVLNKRNGASFERRDQMLLERIANEVSNTLEQLVPQPV